MVTLPSNCCVTNIDVVYALLKEECNSNKELELDCYQVEQADSSFVQILLSLQQGDVCIAHYNIPPALTELYAIYDLPITDGMKS